MGRVIEPSKPPCTFVMSAQTISQPGQALLKVLKNNQADRGGNAYVQMQVPIDFAEYLLCLQEEYREINDALDKALTDDSLTEPNV